MQTLFFICAIVGGTLMLCQFLMMVLGIGGHHEVGGDHDIATDHDAGHHEVGHDKEVWWFVGLLTFRTVVAALTFFGLAGWYATASGLDNPTSLAVGVVAGGAAMYLVALLMRSLSKLQASGTVRIERAVGTTGTVYLTIPGQKVGAGKVHLNLQNRTVEYLAVTSQEQLPTGAKVVVVAVVGSDTVEVAPAP